MNDKMALILYGLLPLGKEYTNDTIKDYFKKYKVLRSKDKMLVRKKKSEALDNS